MKEEFYIVDELTGYARAMGDEGQIIVEQCPVCGSALRKRKNEKLKFHFEGKRIGDYYYTHTCNLISKRMLQLLKDSGITGFVEKEIECTGWYDRHGNKLDMDFEYVELEVTGRGGDLFDIDGEKVKKCPECNNLDWDSLEEVEGLSIGEEWDGSDIFYFDDWEGAVIVTQRVKDLLESEGMKNIDFTKLSEYEPECFNLLPV